MSKQRLFEVGDKVRSCRWHGVLEIAKIVHASHSPVVVYDAAGDAHTFTLDGKYLIGDIDPSLYHAETGSPCVVGEPPERFEYPLYMESEYGLIVKFTAICTATVVHTAPDSVCDAVGESSACYCKHTDRRVWTPCDKPVWKPINPTWCWVWDDAATIERFIRLVTVYKNGTYSTLLLETSRCMQWDNAEPCDQEDIPDYWPESWK